MADEAGEISNMFKSKALNKLDSRIVWMKILHSVLDSELEQSTNW
jgi:hypothetical protein